MKNIHVLPTENSSRLSYNENSVLELHRLQWRKGTQNIYITSDEEIKEVNFYYDDFIKQIIIADNKPIGNDCKKIILTTDQDLIKDGVQAIDDEFLEWFVKNPSCEYIKTEKWLDDEGGVLYSRIIPKEEPKQETLEEVAERIRKELIHAPVGIIPNFNDGFEQGAKWQQEQDKNNYEEDMKRAYCNGGNLDYDIMIFTKEGNHILNEWFEQFKKK